MFSRQKISEKGALFKVKNTGRLHVLHESGGTGLPALGGSRIIIPNTLQIYLSWSVGVSNTIRPSP